MDLENDHYEGLKIFNSRIGQLQEKLEWSNRNGRKLINEDGKVNQEESQKKKRELN